jgi:hypothetical protein
MGYCHSGAAARLARASGKIIRDVRDPFSTHPINRLATLQRMA